MVVSHSRTTHYRPRLRVLGVLILSTMMSLGLLVMRWFVAGHLVYRFLIWDLVLAWVPLGISMTIYLLHERGSRNRFLMFSLGIAWLLFFPNAPYLLTEFVHLRGGHNGPWWCDLLLTLGVAWNGLLLGLVSLFAIQRVIHDRLGTRWSWWTAFLALGLGSFGISLGRFQRFNSWNIINHPFSLMTGIANELLQPSAHPKQLATAGLLCGFLVVAYLMFWALVTLREDEVIAENGI